jgi:hypothetical protein
LDAIAEELVQAITQDWQAKAGSEVARLGRAKGISSAGYEILAATMAEPVLSRNRNDRSQAAAR